MKKQLQNLLLPLSFYFSRLQILQALNLGTAANFVLFSSAGAIGNTGISQLTVTLAQIPEPLPVLEM